MESNGLSTRMYSNMGLEMNLQPQNTQHPFQKHNQINMGYSPIDQQQTQLSMKLPNYLYNNNNSPNLNLNPNPTQKTKIQTTQVTNSDEDDQPNSQNDQDNNSSETSKRKADKNNNNNVMCPWQRMKWTDNMVRLLIMAVYYIGDENGGVSEAGLEKKKSGGSGSGSGIGGALQKKGKWKSVSKAMMEKGFNVSPQQCEDKFNDLNKRYKRVNDILGKGVSCKVVENQGLLDCMDIDKKLKDEVKKLLNSKHLFFREMCAYHNSPNLATNQVQPHQQPPATLPQPSPCFHSAQILANNHNNNHSAEYEDENEDEDEDEDEAYDEDEYDHNEEGNVRKRGRMTLETDSELKGEVMGMLEDGSKSVREKKNWVMNQMLELEENGVRIRREGLELEKERLRWMKYSSKKERVMERMKIENERKRLENQRMLLSLRKKDVEFLFVNQQLQH